MRNVPAMRQFVAPSTHLTAAPHVPKQPSRWPGGRDLFDARDRRRDVAVWVVMVLSVVSTVLLVGLCRHAAL